jgi:transposase
MSGKFIGITDEQWKKLAPALPKATYVFGRPHIEARKVLNTVLYVLISGCRWCDVPSGDIWAARSTAHRYLGLWSDNGTLSRLRDILLADAELKGLIDWQRFSVDGSFSPWERRR